MAYLGIIFLLFTNIALAYVFWPIEYRRFQERQSLTRRMVGLRTRAYHGHAFQQQTTQTMRNHLQGQILTEEERKMLNDMNRRY
jgi:hypothetical protein